MRLHSECLTGDALGSLKCDCGPQLAGALEAITQKAPSLVLSDIVMPDLDGFELEERIRGLDADIPVLFMSGYVDADRLAEISSGGQTIDMVAKPFTSVELLKRVAAALRRD